MKIHELSQENIASIFGKRDEKKEEQVAVVVAATVPVANKEKKEWTQEDAISIFRNVPPKKKDTSSGGTNSVFSNVGNINSVCVPAEAAKKEIVIEFRDLVEATKSEQSEHTKVVEKLTIDEVMELIMATMKDTDWCRTDTAMDKMIANKKKKDLDAENANKEYESMTDFGG